MDIDMESGTQPLHQEEKEQGGGYYDSLYDGYEYSKLDSYVRALEQEIDSACHGEEEEGGGEGMDVDGGCVVDEKRQQLEAARAALKRKRETGGGEEEGKEGTVQKRKFCVS